jgi:hypothetical protein
MHLGSPTLISTGHCSSRLGSRGSWGPSETTVCDGLLSWHDIDVLLLFSAVCNGHGFNGFGHMGEEVAVCNGVQSLCDIGTLLFFAIVCKGCGFSHTGELMKDGRVSYAFESDIWI